MVEDEVRAATGVFFKKKLVFSGTTYIMNHMTLSDFLEKLNESSETVCFTDTIAVIETNYCFSETTFKNGETENQAGTNSGSCKLFAFAKMNHLSEEKTLACFGDYYRKDVLKNPEGEDHANIRNFMKSGWGGITFEGEALKAK